MVKKAKVEAENTPQVESKVEKYTVRPQIVAEVFTSVAPKLKFDWFEEAVVGEEKGKTVIFVYCSEIPNKGITHDRWATMENIPLIYRLKRH